MRYFKSAAFLLALLSGSVPVLSRTAQAAPEDASATPQSAERKFGGDLSSLLDSAQGETNRALLDNLAPKSSANLSAIENAPSPMAAPVAASVTAPMVALEPAEPAFSTPALSTKAPSAASKSMDIEALRQMIQSAESPASDSSAAEPSASDSPSVEASGDVQIVPVLSPPALSPPALSQSPAQSPAAPQVPDAPLGEDDLPTLEDAPDPVAPEPATPEPAEAMEGESPVIDSETEGTEAEAAEDTEAAPAPGASNVSEIGGFPDSLLADPNPLSVPTVSDEVDIERNPVVTLEQAVDLAYRNNQALQTSVLQLEQAEAQLDEVKAARIPTVTAGAGLQRLQQGGDNQTTLNGSLQVDYDLFTGGQRGASIRSAELQTQVAALAVEAQQEQILLVTANLYYSLQDAGEQIRINESFVAEAERNLRDSELRQDVGVGTQFDVLRADVQLANAQQQLVQSRFNQDIARRDISRLLNLPSTAGLQATPVQKAEIWPLDLEESILLAFQNRAELQQQLLQAEISEQQRQIALSSLRPQVGLFASYGLTNLLTTNDSFTDTGFQDGETRFGLNFNMRLFDGGASRANARQQEISGQLSEEQFSENLDQFRFDVEEAFFNLQANDANIVTSKGAVLQAEEALNLANLRLQAGVGTQLEVLSAQTELTEAQGNNVAAILGYNRALAALQRAVSNLRL